MGQVVHVRRANEGFFTSSERFADLSQKEALSKPGPATYQDSRRMEKALFKQTHNKGKNLSFTTTAERFREERLARKPGPGAYDVADVGMEKKSYNILFNRDI